MYVTEMQIVFTKKQNDWRKQRLFVMFPGKQIRNYRKRSFFGSVSYIMNETFKTAFLL